MAKYHEQLQNVWHAYERLHGYVPATARDAVKWGISQGMISLQPVDPYDRMAEDMAKALREEYGVVSKIFRTFLQATAPVVDACSA